MVRLVEKTRQLGCAVLAPAALRETLQPGRWQILSLLAQSPGYASAVAERLGLDEQLAHYHFKRLEKAGVIRVVRTERRRGAVTKFFGVTDDSFAVVLRDAWQAAGPAVPRVLRQFFGEAGFSGRIIVGSPDPHGPYQARSRDSHFAVDLALFLGSFSDRVSPAVRLDTETRDAELKESLVLVGGPIVNLVTARVNSGLPVRIETKGAPAVLSTRTRKKYAEDYGIVVFLKNPWSKRKPALVLAGSTIGGTKAAILAVTQLPGQLKESNVVRGLDLDGDGIVDSVEIVEAF
jgi:DNA-binding transcriptional ArsR family regulator